MCVYFGPYSTVTSYVINLDDLKLFRFVLSDSPIVILTIRGKNIIISHSLLLFKGEKIIIYLYFAIFSAGKNIFPYLHINEYL